MEHDRQRAIAEFKRVMLWIGVAGVLMVIGALSYLGINGHLTFVVAVATIAGVFLSVMLGCGLFAAAFFSDKSGHDQSVTNATQHLTDEADSSEEHTSELQSIVRT